MTIEPRRSSRASTPCAPLPPATGDERAAADPEIGGTPGALRRCMANLIALSSVLGIATVATITTAVRRGDAAPEPQQHSPGELVHALHTAFGEHHARAVHAKGIVLEGSFEPDPEAAALTRAAHLQRTASRVALRFSDFTGLPDIPDNHPAANPRGIAIRFTLPDGAFTDIVGHSFNGFPTATSDEFRDLLLAIAASGPGATPPTALDRFLAGHPIAKTFLTTQHTPASFATITYYGVNAFEVTSRRGATHFIRYQFVPAGGEHLLPADQIANQGANYLFDEIRGHLAQGAIRFDLYAQVAERGDKIDDPSIAWPDTRKRVRLGRITLTRLAASTAEDDRALAFSPTNLLDGIRPADPMIEFRAKAYPISAAERR